MESLEKPRVTVLIHAHYMRELEIILKRIIRCRLLGSPSVEILVGHTGNKDIARYIRKHKLREFVVTNVGRNFATLLNPGIWDSVRGEYVIHLHTKRSPNLPRLLGRLWLYLLIKALLVRFEKLESLTTKTEKQNGIWFPRLDRLFRMRSRIQLDAALLFRNPDELSAYANEFIMKFPAGSMFIAKASKLRAWYQSRLLAGPKFSAHSKTHGEAEHFLERDLGKFFIS